MDIVSLNKNAMQSCPHYFTLSSINIELSMLINIYVEALNIPGCVPAIGSAWQRVLESTYSESVEKAVLLYSSAMSKVSPKLPLDSAELLKHHNDAITKGIQMFQARASLDSESMLYQSYLDKFMVRNADGVSRINDFPFFFKIRIAEYSADGQCVGGMLHAYLQDNLNKSKAACQELLQKLRQTYLDPLIEALGPGTKFGDIAMAFNTILTNFNESDAARGPAAEDVMDSFIEVCG